MIAKPSENARDSGTNERHRMQAGAAEKQAATFAGKQKALGNIGALLQKLSAACLKLLDDRQACNDARASKDGHLMQAAASKKQAATFAGE